MAPFNHVGNINLVMKRLIAELKPLTDPSALRRALLEENARPEAVFSVLPVGVNYQTRQLPVVTFTLMGLNVLVYLISLLFTFGHGKDARIFRLHLLSSVQSRIFACRADLTHLSHLEI
jgi:hypothetical protein